MAENGIRFFFESSHTWPGGHVQADGLVFGETGVFPNLATIRLCPILIHKSHPQKARPPAGTFPDTGTVGTGSTGTGTTSTGSTGKGTSLRDRL